MGRKRSHSKDLGKELRNHPCLRKMQMLLTGKLPTREMLRTLEHASKCRGCYDKLIRQITETKHSRKRR
jgi:hypothetical protein